MSAPSPLSLPPHLDTFLTGVGEESDLKSQLSQREGRITHASTHRDVGNVRGSAPSSPFRNAALQRSGARRTSRTSREHSAHSSTSSSQRPAIINRKNKTRRTRKGPTHKQQMEAVRRRMIKNGLITPGPGSYEAKSSFAKAAKVKRSTCGQAFTHRPRMDPSNLSNLRARKNYNPGPGTHTIKRKTDIQHNTSRKSAIGDKPLELSVLYRPNFHFPSCSLGHI